ncbi:MurR/RpiR family transcriptional regulator [Aeromonas sp. 164P]
MVSKDLYLLFEYARIKFTDVDEKIAEYFYERMPVASIGDLAEKIGVSSASITRFCKKIGVNNFKELLFLYQQKLAQDEPLKVNHNSLYYDYLEIVQGVESRLCLDTVSYIAEAIHRHQVIHVVGFGYSGLAAADFKFRFTRLGKFVEIIQDDSSMNMITSLLTPNSLVLFISLKGKNKEMLKSIQDMRSRGVEVLLITGNEKSKLLEISNTYLLTASLSGEESTGMISGQLPILMAIDHIYVCYVSQYQQEAHKWMLTERLFF